MSNEQILQGKKNIIAIGKLLWEKDLASVLNGNMSVRIDADKILLTATRTCLGLLKEKDVLLVNLAGEVLEPGSVSTEKMLHLGIYKNFPETEALIHTHTVFTNAFFLKNDRFVPQIFESKFFLGEISAIPQNTPSVTDMEPVINGLRKNNILVIKNHGTVAMGKELFDCFLLIQSLEDAVKIDAISRLYGPSLSGAQIPSEHEETKNSSIRKYKMFSSEQMEEIVRLVNSDKPLQELGAKTDMTMDLAVKCQESGQAYCFHFLKGVIKEMTQDEDAEFVITAPESVWRAVFNQEIDPFVATTQKKMHLKGDFAKISRWYAPCSRIFELWQQVPVE